MKLEEYGLDLDYELEPHVPGCDHEAVAQRNHAKIDAVYASNMAKIRSVHDQNIRMIDRRFLRIGLIYVALMFLIVTLLIVWVLNT